MADFALQSEPAQIQRDTVALPRRASVSSWSILRVPLALSLALCLTIPESEVRAKLFKMNLIVKNLHRVSV